ncbi:MAG: mannose-1-phosphate guanylyltransferase/mannose-6-phosphate isomerase [Hyphomicrobiaceae bacterium]
MNNRIQPVILCGGTGTHLWPLSRQAYPKQFLRLLGSESLIQATARRNSGPTLERPLLMTNVEHRFIAQEQLAEIGIEPSLIALEPLRRDTALPVAIAALMTADESPDALLALLPADHSIPDAAGFAATLDTAANVARQGRIVLLAHGAARPSPAFGYVRVAAETPKEKKSGRKRASTPTQGPRAVESFVEKPSAQHAARYLKSGAWLWHTGIVVAQAGTLVTAFRKHAPGILESARNALAEAHLDLGFLRLGRQAFEDARDISFDRAILERAEALACIELPGAWSDLGGWGDVAQASPADAHGNASQDPECIISEGASNCYIHGDGRCVALVGVKNVLVVATRDALLVADKGQADRVGTVVDRLVAEGRDEVVRHKRVYRPWGWYEELNRNHRFQVKCLMVKPGAQLSLQRHFHRSEHWVVVRGTVEVTIGEEQSIVSENQSVYIPLATRHRLANPGMIPAMLIEIQSGSYLGEDDIQRFDDRYGRQNET